MQDAAFEASDGAMRIADIHAIAAAQLEAPDGDFKPFDHLNELNALGQTPRSIPELEARIMLQFAGRIRPARTRIFMNSLRKLRSDAGERALFDAFEDRLKTCLGAQTLVGHGFLPEVFADRDHSAVWDEVMRAVRSLDGLGGEVFLNSGTLLGVVRDGKLIDHDDDVDLGLFIEARTEREAGRIWRALKEQMAQAGLIDETAPADRPQVRLRGAGGLHVDLFPAWIYRDRVFVYPHTYGELSVEDVFPLARCARTGLPVPKAPEKMLAVNYGADWRDPNPYFHFPWKKQKRQFARFLRACGLEEVAA